MRHVVLTLLILLLPIRGWAAESMAVQMAQGQLSAQSAIESAMPADCPMFAELGTAGDDQPDSQSQHTVCPSCQLCMGMTAATSPAPSLATVAPVGLVVHKATAFGSADLLQQQKPPIS